MVLAKHLQNVMALELVTLLELEKVKVLVKWLVKWLAKRLVMQLAKLLVKVKVKVMLWELQLA